MWNFKSVDHEIFYMSNVCLFVLILVALARGFKSKNDAFTLLNRKGRYVEYMFKERQIKETKKESVRRRAFRISLTVNYLCL